MNASFNSLHPFFDYYKSLLLAPRMGRLITGCISDVPYDEPRKLATPKSRARMTLLDLCSYLGLIAIVLATVNICLGLLIAVRYSPWRTWPHRRINYFRIHNWSGYLLLLITVAHPIVLLFSREPRFRALDIALPLWSPSQPFENTIGAVALYALTVVVITSYYRLSMKRRTWKRFHYVVYVAAAASFLHGLLTDPHLKNSPIDYFDGEKVLVEVCFLVVAVASYLALRYRIRRQARRAALLPVVEHES
jgi:predicted ferric reductase